MAEIRLYIRVEMKWEGSGEAELDVGASLINYRTEVHLESTKVAMESEQPRP